MFQVPSGPMLQRPLKSVSYTAFDTAFRDKDYGLAKPVICEDTSTEKGFFDGLSHEIMAFAEEHEISVPELENQSSDDISVDLATRRLRLVSNFDLWF